MTTLRNHLMAITAPIGCIPNLAEGRKDLEAYARYFDALALGMAPGKPGENRVDLIQGTTNAALGQAYGICTLATAVGGTVIELNGVKFTAVSGTPRIANNEFDISGADAADATSLALAITNCTAAGVSGALQACNLATTIALTSVAVGDKVKVNGIEFTAISGASPERFDTFDVSGSNTADAQSLAAAIGAHPLLRTQFVCTNADGSTAVDSNTVYLRQKSGTTGLPLSTEASTIVLGAGAPVAVALVLVTATLRGVPGNAITLKTLGVAASGTLTVANAVVTNTVLINGVTFTGIKQSATATLTAASAVAGDTFVLNGVTFTGKAGASGVGFPIGFSVDTSDTACAADIVTQINAHPTLSLIVQATSSAGVVTIRYLTPGTGGNAITLVGTAVRLAASSATLSGGIAVANDQFDISPGMTDAQVAAALVTAIAASTDALVYQHVRAMQVTSASAVVTVYAINPGIPGNAVTMSTTGGTITSSVTRLTGGTTASAEGAAASGTITISGGSGNYTATINGVATGNVAFSSTDAVTATALAAAINALATLASDHVHATASAGVVTVTASRGGVLGNAITLAGTGTGATVSGARLTGGAVPTTVAFPSLLPRLAGGVGGDAATMYSFTA